MIIEKSHDASTVYNMDETAITYAIGPTHQHIPINQCRAANIGNVNTKLRITAVIAVNALGEFAPLLLIIKHLLSQSQVKLKLLVQNSNFSGTISVEINGYLTLPYSL